MIIENILTDEQKKEVEELKEICMAADGISIPLFLSNEINFNRDIPCFFMEYEEGRLVSFLTLFLPTGSEGELTVFVHPDYRREKRFTRLLQKAIEVLKKYNVPKILFVVDPKSHSGTEVLKTFQNTQWVRSEYTMFFSREKYQENISLKKLKIKNVNEEDKNIYSRLMEKIFEMEEGEGQNFIDNAVASSDREAYLGFDGEVPVGIFSVHYDKDVCFLYGLGIDSNYRKKGYGKELMEYALQMAFEKKNRAVLDVDSGNDPAYRLYLKMGFEIEFQADYYGYDIIKI